MSQKNSDSGNQNSVIHVTTVHPWWDNRIYIKMVSQIAKAGWVVTYICDANGQESVGDDNIKIKNIISGSGLIIRVVKNLQAFWFCLTSNTRLIHFHDPEFLPFGILLRYLGRRVIYDVHEDNSLGILQKEYLPKLIRKPLASLIKLVEFLGGKTLTIVLAEKAYLYRFPNGNLVLNYVNVDEISHGKNQTTKSENKNRICKIKRLIYTGSMSIDRGAYNYIDILRYLDDYELHLIGKCDEKLKIKLIERAGYSASRLFIHSSPAGIPYEQIECQYLSGGWTWGLAVFPKTPHYYEKELTKLFEYMYYKIPILASNFPTWEKLITQTQSGLLVNPEDMGEVSSIIKKNEGKFSNYIDQEFGLPIQYTWASQLEKLLTVYRNAI